MVATITKIGEGAFADVFGCYADDWKQLALKVWTGLISDMTGLLNLSWGLQGNVLQWQDDL